MYSTDAVWIRWADKINFRAATCIVPEPIGDRSCHANCSPSWCRMDSIYTQNIMRIHPPISSYRIWGRNCICDATCMCENVDVTDRDASRAVPSLTSTTTCANTESAQGHHQHSPTLVFITTCPENDPTIPSAQLTQGFTKSLLSTSFTLLDEPQRR
jgi:hypothetical protein